MLFSNPFKNRLPSDAEALAGRDVAIWDGAPHCVLGTPTMGPFSDHLKTVQLGLGCFWGAEGCSGKSKGSTARQSAMRVARPRTRHMKRYVQGGLAIRK